MVETYYYSVEWAALPILATLILSFHRDYDRKSIHNRYLKIMYDQALFSNLMTIGTIFFNGPLQSPAHVVLGYVVNILYFMALPVTALMYGMYTQFTTRIEFSKEYLKKKVFPLTIPYLIYLVVLFVNLPSGNVFTITQEMGYVRGPLYQMPYPVVASYLIWVLVFVARKRKMLSRDAILVITSSMITALMVLISIYINPNVIATGILNTICILILHLYLLNGRKTEDIITGLQNRSALLYHILDKIKENEKFSLYLFSIRGMKRINDQYGLRVGDKKLYHIANVFLQYVTRAQVFRYSGDEFALLLPYHHDEKPPCIAYLEQAFEYPAVVEDNDIPIRFVAVRVDFPTFGAQMQDLISAADYGIHLLKNKNPNGKQYLYDIAVATEMHTQHGMVNQLHAALDRHSFVVHYQPICHLPSGKFTQAEALVRMGKEDGSLIYPGDFIEAANNAGIIVEMTYHILEQVCQDLQYLYTTQPNTPLQSVSINVPYLQFTMPDMEERFLQILQRYNIAPRQIKIEVTERIVVSDMNLMREKMQRMIAKGFVFELDDFGTDYSNLKMCLSLPTDIIKIDRSLLLAAMASEGDRGFFRHLIAGVNEKGRKTLLEGVETQEHLNWATECNCEYVQGYYFSRPIDFKSFAKFLLK